MAGISICVSTLSNRVKTMSSRRERIMKMALGDICRREEIGNQQIQNDLGVDHNIEGNASLEMKYQEKVMHYLESVGNNTCKNDVYEFNEPQANTDIGMNITAYSVSPKPECSVPFLELSDESPDFEKCLSKLTSAKRILFDEHPKPSEEKIKIIQNITLKPIKPKNHDKKSKSGSSMSFSTINDNSFDVDYRLPSLTSFDEESPAKYSTPVIRMVYDDSLEEPNDSTQQICDVEPDRENVKIKNNKKCMESLPETNLQHKVFCTLCYEEVGHFARHLERNHADDEGVQKILGMPLGSNERRLATSTLRKKGNFLWKNEKHKLRVLRDNNDGHLNEKDCYPCVNCLEFYKKSYLWRHKKICKANPSNDYNKSNQHATNSQTFMVTTGILGNFLNKPRIKTEVFSIMRADNISFIAKSDPLICLYGEQMNLVASSKMRETARLKIAIMKASSIKSLIDVLKPCHYELIVASAKVVSGYDPHDKTYKASSLALHFGTNLKFLCDVAKKAILTKNPLFLYDEQERKDKLKQISLIKDLISNHWCNDVSSLANKVLNEFKFNKPKILPVTEDVKALNEFIKTKSQEAYENLKKNLNSVIDYKVLIECILVQVLIFNRKRVGEVQFLEIKSYKADSSSIGQNELMNALTDFEKAMSSAFKRVVVFGKGSRPVPLLFTKRMQKLTDMILRVREETDIVPKNNPYVFANAGCPDRWISGQSAIRKYAHMCGAKNPETLTSTRFRKQIATILQIMNFESDELEQIAKFMGHTEKTHREFYRMSEDIYQTAKVAKVLLLMNNGKGKEFKALPRLIFRKTF